MSRCGLEPENYFEHEDFLSIFDFNSPDTITELDTAVSQGSETVLWQIKVTIKKYEREKSAEESAEHGERPDLHTGGRLSDPQSGPAGTARLELEQVVRMHRTSLNEHHSGLFNCLTLRGTLFSHLLEIKDAANSRLEQMMSQLVKAAGKTEQLKANGQMK